MGKVNLKNIIPILKLVRQNRKQRKINKKANKKSNKQEIEEIIVNDDVGKIGDDLHIKELRQELRRVKYNQKFVGTLCNTIGTLLVVASIAVLIANLWLPILQVTGTSMSPTLKQGQILVATKTDDFECGDIVAFYYNNKILVKRVIGKPGDRVLVSDEGSVYLNGQKIDEPYLTEKALGDCDIEMPYQVPESKIFVMGDNRSVSLDSRNTRVGCIAEEQVIGKVEFVIWPLGDFGSIK